MSTKNLSVVTLSCLFIVLLGLTVLAGCGGGSSSSAAATTSPAVTLSSSSLTFTSGVGVASTQQVTVTNSGTGTLTFSGITTSTGFTQTNTCGTSLGASAACMITVSFTPSATAAVTGSLTITDNASGSPQTVSLSGSGTAPAVTLSPSSLAFTSGVGVASTQQVTVTNSGTGTLTFSGITTSTGFTQTNTCGTSLGASAACMITVSFTPSATAAVTGSLTITDNASGSPQTVSLSGSGTAVSVSASSLNFTSSAGQPVTLTNSSSAALAVTSVSVSGTFTETNNCTPSVGANGSCTITVTPTGSAPWTGTLTIVDAAGTQTVSLTGTGTASNTVPIAVNFGPSGYLGPPTTTTSSYYNGVFTSVTVCQPGTTTCVTVPNVLVDTGSVGFRVLSTALTGVTLSQINDGSGDYLNECTEYGDGSFNWGPVSLATLQIGGETASQVPTASGGTANTGIAIQLISSDTVPTAVVNAGQCVASSSTPDEYTVKTLGANGILGIGNQAEDCSLAGVNYCDNSADVQQYGTNYWLCTLAGDCGQGAIPDQYQLWNPVAAFSSSDTNGVLISLPSIPAAGQVTVTNGTLTFGIGTQTNNAIGSATIYELDGYGNFDSSTLNGVTYTSTNSFGTFIDTGTNTLAVSDPTTLNTTDCNVGGVGPQYDIGYYCPGSPLSLSLGLTGSNSTSTTVTLTIDNALDLFSANTSFAAFNNLGGPSCVPTTTSPCTAPTSGADEGISPDYFDLGLPFFFGRPIFVGIAGTTVGGTNYGNGYWAF